MTYENWYGGQFVGATSGETFQSPSKLQPEDTIAATSAIDIVMTIQAVKKNEAKWQRLTIDSKKEILGKMAMHIRENAAEWARMESRLTGLPHELLYEQNYAYSANVMDQRLDQGEEPAEAGEGLTRGPVGLCVIMLPWVMSLRVFAERFVPAFMASNLIIVKASEKNPFSGRIIAELFDHFFKEGSVALLQGRGEEIGPTLCGHPAVKAVDFTGRYENAEKFLSHAGQLGRRVRLFSGSMNSAVLLDDCDFSSVIPALFQSAFSGQGQLSECIHRVFVSQKRQQDFLEAMNDYLSQNVGEGQELHLITEADEVAFKKAVADIHAEGAKFLTDPSSPHLIPQICYDLTMCSEYQQNEIRGPLLIINEYKYPHEAAKWINTGYYGQAAQIWGSDEERAKKLAAQLQVGTVWYNKWFTQAPLTQFVQNASGFNADSPASRRDFYSTFSQWL